MVVILLSAYNGEKYIEKQIVSLLHQKGVNFRIIIRDDGSKDDTIGIITRLAQQSDKISIIKGQNVGFIGSFTELVLYASQHCLDADYYAFCDQDDIWYPDKLKKSVSPLTTYDQKEPLLFSCNSDLIDEFGKKIGDYRSKLVKITKENYPFNVDFQGCSMCFNRKALETYAKHPPKNICHDKWMSMICNFLGEYVHSEEHLFGYRIHTGNAIGLKIDKGVKDKIIDKFNYWFRRKDTSTEYKVFYDTFHEQLKSSERKLLLNRIYYKESLPSKLWLIRKRECCPRINFKSYIKYCIHLVLNRY